MSNSLCICHAGLLSSELSSYGAPSVDVDAGESVCAPSIVQLSSTPIRITSVRLDQWHIPPNPRPAPLVLTVDPSVDVCEREAWYQEHVDVSTSVIEPARDPAKITVVQLTRAAAQPMGTRCVCCCQVYAIQLYLIHNV